MAYWRLFYHFVWATKARRPLITPGIEPSLYRWLYHEANKFHCPFCYIGGLADHIHVLAALRPSIAPAAFVKQFKGSSSRFISLEYDRAFEWQVGYGVFSVSDQRLDAVKAYVLNQRAHHAGNTLVMDWEKIENWNVGPEIDE